MTVGGGGGVSDVGFVVHTVLSPVAVRAQGLAVLHDMPAGEVQIVEVSANAGSVRYDVLGRDGTLLMVLRVSWHELGGGARRVTLSTHGHRVLERRVLGRRWGRRVVLGAAVAEAFARGLRARLS